MSESCAAHKRGAWYLHLSKTIRVNAKTLGFPTLTKP